MLYIVNNLEDIKGIDWNTLKPTWIVYHVGFKWVDQLGKYPYGLRTYVIEAKGEDFEKLIIVENSTQEEKERLENFIGQTSVEHLHIRTPEHPDYYKRYGVGDCVTIYCKDNRYHGKSYDEILDVINLLHKDIQSEQLIYYRYFSSGTWYIDNDILYTPSTEDFVILDSSPYKEHLERLRQLYPESKIVFKE